MEILYADAGDASLAYVVEGSADLPLIYIPGIVSNLAMDVQNANVARFFERMGRIGRFVRWDRRGTGLSDQSAAPLPLAEQSRDLEALRKAVGFERFALVGYSQGTPLALRYAMENPERVSHLVVIGSMVSDDRDPADPDSDPFMPPSVAAAALADFPKAIAALARVAAPSLPHEQYSNVETLVKSSVSPKGMQLLLGQVRELDLRSQLPQVSVPTLVIHMTDDRMCPVEHGRYIAEHVPGARYLEIDSDFHAFFVDAAATALVLTAIEEFLTGSVVHTADRVMTTVLFTDIVDSSAAQRRLGDEAWRALRKAFEANSQRIAEQFGGRVVEFTGDGVMASFPAASQALRAAKALHADASALGVGIRAGVHAGEAYTVDEHLFGACVTVAARVMAQAGAGETCTTETVQDLVSGSDFRFRSIGRRELKGIGERTIVAVD